MFILHITKSSDAIRSICFLSFYIHFHVTNFVIEQTCRASGYGPVVIPKCAPGPANLVIITPSIYQVYAFVCSYKLIYMLLSIFESILQWCSRNSKRILYEICLLIRELAIRRTNLTLIVRLGTKSDLLIGKHYCTKSQLLFVCLLVVKVRYIGMLSPTQLHNIVLG